jgi:hypothetical protein
LIRDLIAPLRGQPTDLLAFDEVRERLELRHLTDQGLREVELDRIVGSLGRAREFNRAFLPRSEALRDRWEEIERLAEGPLGYPPVELYEVGGAYFVVDGHHRVSVARSLGTPTIEARVKEFQTAVPVAPDDSIEDLVIKQGRADFLEATGIETADEEEYRATVAHAYGRLVDHVSVHRYYRGLELDREVDWREAVQSWRDAVYRPVIEAIRSRRTLEKFPGRTETDLYLFVMDHLHALRESCADAGPEQAVAELSRNPAAKRELGKPSRRGKQEPS